ncbi:hypothetical protein GOBAR_DD31371 [Gossypium barbadense]|nr:hypothetical protein GOBAR_DD31371 [Gossypium barbadense]
MEGGLHASVPSSDYWGGCSAYPNFEDSLLQPRVSYPFAANKMNEVGSASGPHNNLFRSTGGLSVWYGPYVRLPMECEVGLRRSGAFVGVHRSHGAGQSVGPSNTSGQATTEPHFGQSNIGPNFGHNSVGPNANSI